MKRKKSNYKSQNDQQKIKKCQQRIEEIKDNKIREIGKDGFEKYVGDYFKRILDANNAPTECATEVPKTSNVEKLLGEMLFTQRRLLDVVSELEWKLSDIAKKMENISYKMGNRGNSNPNPYSNHSYGGY